MQRLHRLISTTSLTTVHINASYNSDLWFTIWINKVYKKRGEQEAKKKKSKKCRLNIEDDDDEIIRVH